MRSGAPARQFESRPWLRAGMMLSLSSNRLKAFGQLVLPGGRRNVPKFSRPRAAIPPVNIVQPILKTENLRVEFRSKDAPGGVKVALQGLNLSVFPGETFGFVGPNGAGKTTTMNVLLGFVNATRGDAFLFGENVREPIARQRIGYLPELTYYYKFLTAEELLRFYARIFNIPKAEREKRIDAVLKLVELDHARKRQIKTYSKGMQQRAGLAQALINNPDLLILDEPTSGLDPIGRMKVREIIQRLKNEGKTVFFSSHELGEVETICDRVAILHQGELKREGRVADIVREYNCDLEQAFLRIIGFTPQPAEAALETQAA